MEDAWQVPLHIISIDCMLEYKYILLDCPLLKRLWLCDMGCVCVMERYRLLASTNSLGVLLIL